MLLSRLYFALAFVACCGLYADGGVEGSKRGRELIAAELAANPLPRVDVAGMADPDYATEFGRRRDLIRQKRAELILEFYKIAPREATLDLLAERWQTLAQGAKASLAVAEMSEYLAGNVSVKDKEEAAYQRALLVIGQTGLDTSARLGAIEEFRKVVSAEPAGSMLAQLLYRAGRLAPEGAERDRLLGQVVAQYPESPAAKVMRGATRRQEALGKTMEVTFNDAITGTPIDLADFRGKVVVVDFWAAWCTDCAAAMPTMKKVYAQFKDKGVEFIGVSLDVPEAEGGLAALKAAVARHQLKWPQYYLGKEWDSDFSSTWGVYSVPAVYVLDRQGKVVSIDAGGKLEAVLAEVLKPQKP